LKERPPGDAGESAFHDYVYLRDNPRGQHRELWQHEAGCRRWLIVTRNTATHEIASVDFASGAEKPR
jgi:sarcosine oxidase subunit delta